MARHKIYSALQKYGPICSISEDCYYPVEIDLMRTEKTDQLKTEPEIEIESNKCTIEWQRDKIICMEIASVAEALTIPPDQESPHNIHNSLNDDCLRAIFEADQLSLDDLCSIGSVCERFNSIAKQVFESRYKNEQKCLTDMRTKHLCKIEEYFRIARNTAISYWDFKDPQVIFGFILKYCKNLKQIVWNDLNQSTLNEMRPFLDQLTEIKLTSIHSCDFTGVFTSVAALDRLDISLMHDKSRLPDAHLPKLTNLRLSDIDKLALTESVERLFQLNGQLKTLSIDNEIVLDFQFERALKHLPNIEELFIRCTRHYYKEENVDMDLTYLPQLKYLKTLRYEGYYSTQKVLLSVLVDSQVSLDCLILDYFDDDTDYPMAYFPNLKIVECFKIGRLDSDTILDLLRSLPKANEIEIFTERMTLEDIHEVLQLNNHPTKITYRLLDIDDDYLSCDSDTVDEIDRIRTERGIDLKVMIEIDAEHNNGQKRDDDVSSMSFSHK